jgi:hypothetical protein
MSALRMIAWGTIDFDALDHRGKLEMFAEVNRELRRRPHRMCLREDGIYGLHGEGTVYVYRLLGKPRRFVGRAVRNVIISSSPMQRCCQRALELMGENNPRR